MAMYLQALQRTSIWQPEAYLEPRRTSTMQFLHKNNERLNAVKYFQKKTPLQIFEWSLNTPLVSILHLVRKNLRCFWQVSSFNPFVPNAPFLYPLKTYGLISHLLINPSFSGKAQNSTLTPTFTFSRPRTLLGFLSKGLYCRPFQIMFQAVLTVTKCAFARFS